jgi:protein involved in temperature-dependent protein secretion
MKLRYLVACASTAVTLALVSGCATADEPVVYGGPNPGYYLSLHPNIAAADENAAMAIDRIRAAQRDNGYDMGGHAGRAIALLQEARAEMQAAAVSATR